MKLIERHTYIDQLKQLNGTPDIKIITGMRRVGKSELLKAYLEYLKNISPDCNIIEIDFMDLKYDNLKNYKKLYNYVENHYNCLLYTSPSPRD